MYTAQTTPAVSTEQTTYTCYILHSYACCILHRLRLQYTAQHCGAAPTPVWVVSPVLSSPAGPSVTTLAVFTAAILTPSTLSILLVGHPLNLHAMCCKLALLSLSGLERLCLSPAFLLFLRSGVTPGHTVIPAAAVHTQIIFLSGCGSEPPSWEAGAGW
jgi:hypothetical protein